MKTASTVDTARKHLVYVAVAASCVGGTAALADSYTYPERQAKETRQPRRVGSSTTEVVSAPVVYATSDADPPHPLADRETTDQERGIGELRRWMSLQANWDGDGALQPVERSLKEASSFLCAMDGKQLMPEPMLHTSGRAGLFWKTTKLYADLEFLGDGRIAYYLESGSDRHKGVVSVDSAAFFDPFFKRSVLLPEAQFRIV